MSITQVKGLSWLASVALFAYMFLFVWNFELGLPAWAGDVGGLFDPAETKGSLRIGPSEERQIQVLSQVQAPPPEADDLVDYKKILAAFVEQDFSGRPPAVVPDVAEVSEEDLKPPVIPVSELLRVIFIRFDSAGVGSVAVVKYIAPELALVPTSESGLYVDDRLPAPYEHVYVESIDPGVVTFAFEDEEREAEELETAEFGDAVSFIAKVGADGTVLMPATDVQIPTVSMPVYNPAQTTAIRSNNWIIGTDDAAEIGENWNEIFSRDVRVSRHRNPRTGKYDGIEINSIRPGSVAARFGAEAGDVLKSINGHPVSSRPEAIKFVKNNDDVYDTWQVVIERLGREVTMTYEEPPSN